MYKVVLDPGHGGKDTGAVNSYITEKDLNLKVAVYCMKFLSGYPIEVILTRNRDIDVDLKTRSYISNEEQANLFVSMHNNASGQNAKGYEVYHYTGSVQGQVFAELLAEEFNSIGLKKRYVGSGLYMGTKKGDYAVLKETKAIACLSESGFIDSDDYKKMDEAHEIQKIGEAHGKAILRYFNIKIKEKNNDSEDKITKKNDSVSLYATIEDFDSLKKSLKRIEDTLKDNNIRPKIL